VLILDFSIWALALFLVLDVPVVDLIPARFRCSSELLNWRSWAWVVLFA
jgi:hypothetical protein